jgi:hypothetical protein
MANIVRLKEANEMFQTRGAVAGPCDAGGSKQACLDADAQALAALRAMLNALERAQVPDRFVEADRLLREALRKNIEGIELRDDAIRLDDRTLWTRHADVLKAAVEAWAAGYAAFPADNRPALGP